MGRSSRQIQARAKKAEIQAEIGRKYGLTQIAKLPNGLATAGTLSRTVADTLRGKISSNVIKQSSEAGMKSQYKIALANQEIQRGRITAQQYTQRVAAAGYQYKIDRKAMTQNFAHTASIKAKSETAKRDEARSIAASKGIALGTVAKDGTASVSLGSEVGRANVSDFKTLVTPPALSTQTKREDMVQVTTPDSKERVFKDRTTAEKFVDRVENNYQSTLGYSNGKQIQGAPPPTSKHYSVELFEGGEKNKIAPVGSLGYLYGDNKKYTDSKRYDNLGLAAYAGFGNALRYSAAVDSGEVEQPKGLENLGYFASLGIRPISNIFDSIAGHQTENTSMGSLIDIPIELAMKGETDSHNKLYQSVKSNPAGTVVQFPAEALLWITGGKAIGYTGKMLGKYSPVVYQSSRVITGEGKSAALYRGITFKNKPVIGVQSGKVTFGYNAGKVADVLGKTKIENLGRDGFELAKGSGVNTELIYSKKTLNALVGKGVIPEIGAKRATQARVITDQGIKIHSKVGEFGKAPIEGLTDDQAKVLLNKVVKGEKAGDIDTVHGSGALRPQLPNIIKNESGTATLLGDIDVIPTGATLAIRASKADKLIQGFAQDFPLKAGQRLSIKNLGASEKTNRALELIGGHGQYEIKTPKKILEVVLKDDDTSSYGINIGSKILGHNIPSKTVRATDIPVKISTADYQLLTNVKQVVSFQKGKDTLLDVFPSSGRTKDIVRVYWNVKAKAVFKGGEKGKALDIEAEKFRSLYKGLDWGKPLKGEKFVLSSRGVDSSLSIFSVGTSKASVIPSVLKSVKVDSKLVSSKPSSKPSSVKPSVKSSMKTSSVKSLTVKSIKIASIKGSSELSIISPKSSITPKAPNSNLNVKIKGNPYKIKGSSSKINVTSKLNITSPPARMKLGGSVRNTPSSKMSIVVNYPKAAPIPWIITKDKTKRAKGEKKYSHNFLGSSHAGEIMGFRTNKSDLTVGDKKTRKLYTDDIIKTKKKTDKRINKNVLALSTGSKRNLQALI